MSDVFILYIGVMYLFTLGITMQAFVDGQDSKAIYIGMVVNLVFAPIVTPIIFGWLTYEKLN